MFSSIKTPLYILQTYNVHFVQTHFFFRQYTFQYCQVEFSPKVSSPKNWIFGHISFSDLRTLFHFRRIELLDKRTFGLKNPISFSDQRTFGQTKLRQRAAPVSCYKKKLDYLTPPNFTDLSFNMITTHTQKLRKIKTTFFLTQWDKWVYPDCKATHILCASFCVVQWKKLLT